MKLNTVYNEDCLDTMNRMPDNFIDLVVTSPPYDNLREYKGYSFDFELIALELYRVVKEGGVVVWVVGDATIDGSETGTSFKQALYFKEIGFNLHDTMIYKKASGGAVGSNYCYWQAFEYMFILSKGKPKAVNRIKDRRNVSAGSVKKEVKKNVIIGSRMQNKDITIDSFGYRNNVWEYQIGFANKDDSTDHPAPFPEQLAQDHIISWSNENDIVYDPFAGSGTTLKMALQNNRQYIGSEISEEYVENIIKPRLQKYTELKEMELF